MSLEARVERLERESGLIVRKPLLVDDVPDLPEPPLGVYWLVIDDGYGNEPRDQD